jgi:hypothetical protein
VDFVVRPPHDLFLDKSQQDQFTLYAALLIDYVWSLRNKVVHGGDKPNRDDLGRGLWNRFFEHWSMLSKSDKIPSSYLKEDIHWMRPVRNGIKLNCDAAVGVNGSVVAGIARDWRGSLVFAFVFKVNTNLPIQAEAEALRMAASIVIEHNLHSVCLESDCKSCIDGLLDSNIAVPWQIVNLVKEIRALVQCIFVASVNWAPRKANMVTHTLARWSLESRLYGFFLCIFCFSFCYVHHFERRHFLLLVCCICSVFFS